MDLSDACQHGELFRVQFASSKLTIAQASFDKPPQMWSELAHGQSDQMLHVCTAIAARTVARPRRKQFRALS